MSQAVTPINTQNKTSNFYPSNPDQWLLTELPFVASVAMEQGTAVVPQIVSNTTTGNYTKTTATNANWANFSWILAETISTTDADYATAWKRRAIWIPKTSMAEAYFRVWAGTFTAVDVGKVVSFHSDSSSLAVDTQWNGAIIAELISSTRWVCTFWVAPTVTA